LKVNLTILSVGLIILGVALRAYAWNGKTHKGLTEKAVSNNNQSILDGYLKSELEMLQGVGSILLLDESMTPDANRVLPQVPENPSVSDLLKAGAYLEDVPNPRAKHHFHDPYRNTGLENKTEHPSLARDVNWWSNFFFGLDFDLTGASALQRVLGTEGGNWESEYVNYFAWPDTRDYFYKSLTDVNEKTREHYLALTFLSLGHVLHLLEDMGVPPHVRNDFIEAHFRVPRGLWGNPFESYVDGEANESGFPAKWLTGWTPQSKAFPKLSHYWDVNGYNGQYVGTSPLSSWGLSERTNYQFLSKSTIFRENVIIDPNTGERTKYYFPHPDACNVTGYIEPGVYSWNSIPVHYRYISGYGITHLARTKYIEKYAYAAGMPYPVPVGTVVYHTTFDKLVYEDYAKVTIPRTIDYATGLANYFFRGRLSAEQNCISSGEMELYVTNDSNNSGTPQTLKGGDFEVYWNDTHHNRHKMDAVYFTIFDSNDSCDNTEWGINSVLAYGESIRISIIQPPDADATGYILVYKGQISQNPGEPDPNDPNAIAMTEFPRCNCQMCPPSDEDVEVYFENTCDPYSNGVYYRLWWRSTKGYWEGDGVVADCYHYQPRIKISASEPQFYSDNDNVSCFPQIVNNELVCGGTCQIDVWKRYTAWKLNNNRSILWRSDTDESFMGYGIAVDGSGNVYVSTYTMHSKNLWKFDRYGNQLWNYNTGGGWANGVAADNDGNVYVTGDRSFTNSKSIWKLDNDGNLLWDYDTGSGTWDVAADACNVYVAGNRSGDKSVWKLDRDGNLIWSYDTGANTEGIEVDNSGNVYVAGSRSGGKSVWKLNSAGGLVWDYDTGSDTRGIAVDSNYNVYVAGNDSDEADYKALWKLSPAGILLWDYDIGQTIVYNYSGGHAVCIDSNDNVYLAGGRTVNYRSVWKFDGDGSLLWDYDTGAYYYYENGFAFDIVVDGSGNIYIASSRQYRW
jgi:hypothetical protein